MRTLCIFLSIIFYVISLFLPAAIIPEFERGIPQVNYGYTLFYSGWLGLLSFQPAWLANLFYSLELLTYGSKVSYRFGIITIILALLSPFIIVEKLLAGFYIWLLSFAILLYGNYLHE
jgi:hypothetical protein